MDNYRSAADPTRINAIMCEARRMRNEALRDLFRALFDGRFLALFTGGKRQTRASNLPKGAAPQS